MLQWYVWWWFNDLDRLLWRCGVGLKFRLWKWTYLFCTLIHCSCWTQRNIQKQLPCWAVGWELKFVGSVEAYIGTQAPYRGTTTPPTRPDQTWPALITTNQHTESHTLSTKRFLVQSWFPDQNELNHKSRYDGKPPLQRSGSTRLDPAGVTTHPLSTVNGFSFCYKKLLIYEEQKQDDVVKSRVKLWSEKPTEYNTYFAKSYHMCAVAHDVWLKGRHLVVTLFKKEIFHMSSCGSYKWVFNTAG